MFHRSCRIIQGSVRTFILLIMPVEKRKSNAKSREVKDKRDKADPVDEPSPTWTAKSILKHVVRRLFTIGALVLAVQYLYSGKELPCLAKQTEDLEIRIFDRNCSNDYKEDRVKFPACAPIVCGRGVMDRIVSKEEALTLLRVAKSGLTLGGSNGGASILDLHSGALSKGDSFINIFKYLESTGKSSLFKQKDFKVYKRVADKIRFAIATQFKIDSSKLYLTSPTFFSRMTNKPAKTVHDEYWHLHIDKDTYETFDYTSLLYLTNYDEDFKGGRFVFVDSTGNKTIEPKFGRVSFFTSGSENSHYVEKVTEGTRYALTVSFTCDKSKAINPPVLSRP